MEHQIRAKKIEYGKSILKLELTKLVFLCIFFLCIHQFAAFCYGFLLLTPLRLSSGGLHFKNNKACFCFSFLFFATLVFLLQHIEPPYFVPVLFGAGAVFALFSPAKNIQKPIGTRKYTRLKLYSMCIFLLISGLTYLMYYCNHIQFGNIGFWILILQTLQLLIAAIKNRKAGT